MKFTENEKNFLKDLIEISPDDATVGINLLTNTLFKDGKAALLFNPDWKNGKYKLYNFDYETNKHSWIKYIEIFKLIDKLIIEKYITLVVSPPNGHRTYLLYNNQKKDLSDIHPMPHFLNEDHTESLDKETGRWIFHIQKETGRITSERKHFGFDNSNVPLEDFLFGLVFISPELVKLVNDDKFKTYEEKTLNIALDSLEESRESVRVAKDGLVETHESVELARKSLEETTKSVDFAKQSVVIAEQSLNTAKRSNCIANWAIGISFVTALGSIGVSIWAENNPDNVTIQNPPDDVIKTSAKDVSKDINNNIDIKFEEAQKLLYLNKSKNKAK